MRPTGPAHPAGTRRARARWSVASGATGGRSKNRELFGKFGGAALRTFRALPILRTDQYFAILPAFLTVKLVNRHAQKVIRESTSFKPEGIAPRAAFHPTSNVRLEP